MTGTTMVTMMTEKNKRNRLEKVLPVTPDIEKTVRNLWIQRKNNIKKGDYT